jgi:hypothetical protein
MREKRDKAEVVIVKAPVHFSISGQHQLHDVQTLDLTLGEATPAKALPPTHEQFHGQNVRTANALIPNRLREKNLGGALDVGELFRTIFPRQLMPEIRMAETLREICYSLRDT